MLLVAGLFEVVWAIGLKHTEGFSRLWPTLLTGSAMVISLGLVVAGLVGLKWSA
jgi:quaternary ammonium compound-resistance protein SugE